MSLNEDQVQAPYWYFGSYTVQQFQHLSTILTQVYCSDNISVRCQENIGLLTEVGVIDPRGLNVFLTGEYVNLCSLLLHYHPFIHTTIIIIIIIITVI